MSDILKPYEEYKFCEFAESVPKHWSIDKFSNLFNENKNLNINIKETKALQFKFGEIIEKKRVEIDDALKATLSKYTIVNPNDIVINGLNLNYDFVTQRIGFVKFRGVITSAYISVTPNEGIDSRYYTFLLKAYDTKKIFNGMGSGIRLTLDYSGLKKMQLPVPPLSEQEQIVKYLNKNILKINKLIKAKKKQIVLLKEQRNIVVNNVVTRGLNQDIKMKQTGLEWVREIPEEWEIKKFKRCFNTTTGISITKAELVEDGIDCIGYGEIHSKYGFELDLKKHELKKAPLKSVENKLSALAKENDFIFCDTSEDLSGSGNNTYIKSLEGRKLVAGSHTVLAQPKIEFESRYLAYLFSTKQWKMQIQKAVNGVKVYSITQRILKDTSLILPSIKEQIEIVEYLDKETFNINTAIAAIIKEIELLTEYKLSLISEVTTGKVDVRNIQIDDIMEDEDNEEIEEDSDSIKFEGDE